MSARTDVDSPDFYSKQFVLLAFVFIAMVTAVTWAVVSRSQQSLIEFQALKIAEIVATQAATSRSLYSSLAVDKLKKDGFGASEYSADKVGHVPLPAQFFKALSKHSLADAEGLYRFKPISLWNIDAEQGLVDEFQTWAWSQLEDQQSKATELPVDWQPVWRIDDMKDGKTLRFLRADPASSMSCVNCHNEIEAQPETKARRIAQGIAPGHRWKQHELLGAVQIEIPLERAAMLARAQTHRGLLVVVAATLIGIAGAAFLLLVHGSRTRAMTHQLNLQARRDSLTGLPNRFHLDDELNKLLGDTENRVGHSVMLLDLDDFKQINDTLGHEVGDEVLKIVGQRLLGALREHDLVARLGGDEFVIVMPDTGRALAQLRAERLTAALQQLIHTSGHRLSTGASFGIAMTPDDGVEAQELLRCADVAMYMAKQSQHGYAFYDEELDENHVSSLTIVHDLREAIRNGSLALHFQPQYCLLENRMVGAEALLRWHHSRHGHVAPDRAVSIAERHGLIAELTVWVLNTALTQCKIWREQGFDLKVSVNLSAVNLHDPQLVEQVEAALLAHSLPPEALVLEVTESAVMTSPDEAMKMLQAIRQSGITLSVDDYGTGHSSLSYLRHLPVQELKLDRSFLTNLSDSGKDAVIVKATLDLAHNLGLSMVAEGVEDAETLDYLYQIGCDAVQGYYLSRPISAQDFNDKLASTYELLPRHASNGQKKQA